jgi:hypothetical protein
MRFSSHAFRIAVAAGLSLWLAALACLVGCTIPIIANAGSIHATTIHNTRSRHETTSIRENSAEQDQPGQPDLMAGMANCPHHSGGNAPAKPGPAKPHPTKSNNPKRVPGGGMSCCPVEVTVASKPDTVRLEIAPAGNFVLAPDLRLTTVRFFHSVEFVPPAWHSGRDTLLETHLLRI